MDTNKPLRAKYTLQPQIMEDTFSWLNKITMHM